jgi:UDPglucose 6-dehydrogenase
MANTIMELCHYSPNTDCDVVINALSLASQRLVSAAYLRGGMGDGGGCHPRDNIALSWYAKQKGLRYDWYENIMIARERQIEFLADIIEKAHKESGKDVILLGSSFKPNTAITTGSPAILLSYVLTLRGIPNVFHDPVKDTSSPRPITSSIYFVSCKHDIFLTYSLPEGSILIDPHRVYERINPNGTYLPIGRCEIINANVSFEG